MPVTVNCLNYLCLNWFNFVHVSSQSLVRMESSLVFHFFFSPLIEHYFVNIEYYYFSIIIQHWLIIICLMINPSLFDAIYCDRHSVTKK